MRRLCILSFLLAAVSLHADEASDLRAARAVFDRNIDAIRHRDRDAYLALYLHGGKLVRGGPGGFTTGFDDFAKGAGARWPDSIEALDIHLTPIRAGIVYGTYRYRVRYGAEEHSGISERLFIKDGDGWKIALTGAIDAPPGTPPPPRAIVGATLLDGRGGAPLSNATIILRDGKIECAGACPVPEGVDVLDAKGLFVTPGLIDAHVHFSQTGWADGRPDTLDVRDRYPYPKVIAELELHPERYAHSYLCSGVTSVFDVGGYPWTLRLADRFANDTSAPHVAAAGPLLSTLDHWLNLPASRQFIHLKDGDTGRDGVRYLAAAGAKAVKVWYIVRNPDLPVEASFAAVAAAGEEARRLGLPLIVHATGLAEAKAALRAGATYLVHSVWDVPVDQELIDLAKQNGAVLSPTLTVLRGRARLFRALVDRKPPAIDDPLHCVDAATMARVNETAALNPALVTAERAAETERLVAAREQMMFANLRKLVDAGIPIATGTDAGNPLTLHGPAIFTEMDAMQAAGMTPMQVLVASTATAARVMGLSASTGTIEKGKDADLVILSADPSSDVANFRRIRYVVRAGVVRPSADLTALAQ
ncbi:MAG TPA: amidohydrolase family protein [Thermoanaerobaculia bacterium]|jgi:imidazolonepropionase-like amidohydrolase|nr:amidohydrolase family protein [Thermoanaerobaculia bacterium]